MEKYRNPFSVFPEEVWEVIIDELDDAVDILSIMTAYPEMSHFSIGKKCDWLSGPLMPLIFPKYLTFDDITICRQVSKRWNTAIGHALETHPDRLSYKSARLGAFTEHHFSYAGLPHNCAKFPMSDYELLFLQYDQMELDLHKSHNPFPGRCVHLLFNLEDEKAIYFPEIWHPPESHLPEAAKFLPAFGHHIWYLHFSVYFCVFEDSENLMEHVVRPMLECFSHLPNLKSLAIALSPNCEIGSESVEIISEFIHAAAFPFQLEALDMSGLGRTDVGLDIDRALLLAFVNHDQIIKLCINGNQWDNSFGSLFPYLSDLTIYYCNKLQLHKIFADTPVTKIRKLAIQPEDSLLLQEILDVLSAHRVEALLVIGRVTDVVNNSTYSSQSSPDTGLNQLSFKAPCPSIQSLSVEVTNLCSFDFLKILPCLQFLMLEINYECIDIADWKHRLVGDALWDYLHQLYIYNCHDKTVEISCRKVWIAFPNIKTFKVRTTHNYKRRYCCGVDIVAETRLFSAYPDYDNIGIVYDEDVCIQNTNTRSPY